MKDLRLILEEKAFATGRHAKHNHYHIGYKAEDGRDTLRVLVDLWTEYNENNEDDFYHETWEFIERAYHRGWEQGKKDIAKENRENEKRIAKMDAERELETNGFGM